MKSFWNVMAVAMLTVAAVGCSSNRFCRREVAACSSPCGDSGPTFASSGYAGGGCGGGCDSGPTFGDASMGVPTMAEGMTTIQPAPQNYAPAPIN